MPDTLRFSWFLVERKNDDREKLRAKKNGILFTENRSVFRSDCIDFGNFETKHAVRWCFGFAANRVFVGLDLDLY